MKLYIRDNKTGEIRPSRWQDVTSRFWWEEGNGSCDCNRHIAFSLSSTISDPDVICGEKRFDLVNEDGTLFNNWPEDPNV